MTRWTSLGGAAVLAAALIVGGSGCTVFRLPGNAEASRHEIEQLRREEAELLAMMRELRERLDTQGETLTSQGAETNVQLRALEDKIEVLRAQLEEQGLRLERGQRRPPSEPAPGSGETGTGTPGGPSAGDDAFAAAQRDFARGNYELAQAGFEEFLRGAPESENAAEAQYWLAECHYSLGDMEKAIEGFLKVRDGYPGAAKRAAATLKVGYAYLRLKNTASARRYFDSVIRDYPGTDEARLATEKLKELQ